jgi:hypothetical protein
MRSTGWPARSSTDHPIHCRIVAAPATMLALLLLSAEGLEEKFKFRPRTPRRRWPFVDQTASAKARGYRALRCG